jgi:hypothetical protein
MRNVGVVDFVLDFNFFSQRAQTSAQDDACFRLEILGVGLDVGGASRRVFNMRINFRPRFPGFYRARMGSVEL